MIPSTLKVKMYSKTLLVYSVIPLVYFVIPLVYSVIPLVYSVTSNITPLLIVQLYIL